MLEGGSRYCPASSPQWLKAVCSLLFNKSEYLVATIDLGSVEIVRGVLIISCVKLVRYYLLA